MGINQRFPPFNTAGNNASFEIQLEQKMATLTWLKDNKPLSDRLADRFSIAETDGCYYQLNIKHCTESDTGLYTARACNSNSDVMTCSAQLIVHEKTAEELKAIAEQNTPHFICTLHDTEVMESTFLRFMLKVTGEPRPKIVL